MRVSTIIPTYNRAKDLNECLDSILNQSHLPLEVIIVDNGKNIEIEDLIKNKKSEFEKKNILLKYVKNERGNSLTAARNLGTRLSSGEIIFFLEDDATFDTNYIQEILKVYETYPGALGVQGYLISEENRTLHDFIYRLFFWYHLAPNKCQVLPSVSATYPLKLDKVIKCQWMSGVSSYRRQIFKEFKFDENLIKYSDGEDLDFSYRVYKRYPGSLFITPFTKYDHHTSKTGRVLGKELIYMREVYGLYLFYKLFNPSLRNKLIYLWSRIGRIFLTLIRAIIKRPPGIISELQYLLRAYYLCLFHIGEIKHGKLEFFNRTLS